VPALGRSLLGERGHANLERWLGDGEHALLVGGRSIYSSKGSGYLRGGLFDRIQFIQGDMSVRFRDRDHRIPADSGFDPAEPY
jgi:NosR/NirI family nitrous oxide reductase transcriptional regulator